MAINIVKNTGTTATGTAMTKIANKLKSKDVEFQVSLESGVVTDIEQDSQDTLNRELESVFGRDGAGFDPEKMGERASFEDCTITDLDGNAVSLYPESVDHRSYNDTAAGYMLAVGAESATLKKYFNENYLSQNLPAQATEIDVLGSSAGLEAHPNLAAGLEAYDDSDVHTYTAANVVFNAAGSRQDTYGEAFYPSKTLPAGSNGYTLMVDQSVVQKENRRNQDGKPADFKREQLLTAYRDDSILATERTTMVATYIAGENDDYFLKDGGTVITETVEVEGVQVEKGYLIAGEEMDLLTLTVHPDLINGGVLDSTDAIDPPLGISEMVVEVTNGNDTELLVLNVHKDRGSEFDNVRTGKNRDAALSWDIDGLTFKTKPDDMSKIVTVTGAESTLLSGAYPIVKGHVAGRTNYEFGNTHVGTTRNFEIAAAKRITGNKVTDENLTDAEIAQLGLTLTLKAWHPDGTRTNLNLRMDGTRLETQANNYVFPTPFQSPLSIFRPTNSDKVDETAIQRLITASYIRNSNNAVITQEEQFERWASLARAGVKKEYFSGPATDIIEPFIKEIELDFHPTTGNVNMITNTAKNRASDVTAILLQNIRNVGMEALTSSNLQAAVDSQVTGSSAKLVMNIGTDPQTARYMQEFAGEKITNLAMESRIVTTTNKRLRDLDSNEDKAYIYLAFTRPGAQNANTVDPLSHGFFNWLPAAVFLNPVTRNGSTSKEVTIQPRCQHYTVCPVMVRITVKNLLSSGASLKG